MPVEEDIIKMSQEKYTNIVTPVHIIKNSVSNHAAIEASMKFKPTINIEFQGDQDFLRLQNNDINNYRNRAESDFPNLN